MSKILTRLLAAALLATPVVAFAHSGHAAHGFADGFVHPFLGADHLLAMLLVGAWSVLHARQVWLAPLTFVTLLAIGALLGQHGIAVPQLEAFVAASVLVFGVMLSLRTQLSDRAALAVIGGFALLHGMAHGGELAAGSTIMAGIVAGSVLLHLIGMGAAHVALQRRPQLALRIGQAATMVGGGLILSAIL